MEFHIACSPEDHPVIPGAGGFRKARWARRGKGKSGGYRVIYFLRPDQAGFIWLRFIPRPEGKPFRRPMKRYSQS